MNSNNYSLIVSLMRATVCTSSKIALTSKEARHFGEPLVYKNNFSGFICTTSSLQRLKSLMSRPTSTDFISIHFCGLPLSLFVFVLIIIVTFRLIVKYRIAFVHILLLLFNCTQKIKSLALFCEHAKVVMCTCVLIA